MEAGQIKMLHLFHYNLEGLLIDFLGVLQKMDGVVHALITIIY